MGIIAECPLCHNKQSIRNKHCSCGADLDKEKENKKVKYHIVYRDHGKQKWRSVGSFKGLDAHSLEDARDADARLRVAKRQNEIEIFDPKPESVMTFKQLAKWYLDLPTIKNLATYDRINILINNFNSEYGDRIINTIKPIDLENFQEMRKKQGKAPATIDMEIDRVGSMIRKAFDNDMADGHTLKAFRRVKRTLKRGSNARRRLITSDEYIKLLKNSAPHLRPVLITAYNTGMRKAELRKLKWAYVDMEALFIRLPKEVTKEDKPKNIPINHHVKAVLKNLPRHEHDIVFTYNEKPIMDKSGLKKSFMTACKDAKIPYGRKEENGITFHDIRRTVKTNMLNAGVDKAHRDMILGHSLKGMDTYYLVATEKSLTAAMDKYTKWLDSQRISDVSENVRQNVRQN